MTSILTAVKADIAIIDTRNLHAATDCANVEMELNRMEHIQVSDSLDT